MIASCNRGGMTLLAAGVLSLLAACGRSDSNAPPGAGPGGPGGPGARGPAAVSVHTVQWSPFVDSTEALGTAKANEAVDLTAKTTNKVMAINFREGDHVKQGQVLLELDSDEARANLASAEASLRDSESQYLRSKELFNTKALAESDMVQIEANMLSNRAKVEAARAVVNDRVIRAPFGGRVGLRNVSVGGLVTPGQVIATLDDVSVIKLDFTVPETFLASVKIGQQVDAASAAYSGEIFRGKVTGIDSRVDPNSRSVMMRAQIDNRDGRLKPGMFMSVQLRRDTGRALMIPEQALMPQGSAQYVYVVRGDTVSKVTVDIGRRRPGVVEVAKGLGEGDVIVVEGAEKLQDGAKVAVTGGSEAPAASSSSVMKALNGAT